MKVASLLLSTTGRACPSSETLWLRLQVLLSAGELDEAWRIVQEEGDGGSLARSWWRMQAVPVIFERMEQKGKEAPWGLEWDKCAEKLRNDTEA